MGNIATFITGAAAVGGLVFAAVEVKRSADQRKDELKRREAEERRLHESMARGVGVDVKVVTELGNPGAIQVTVHNAGRYPIEKVQVIAGTQPVYGETLLDAPNQIASRHPLGTLLPGGQKVAGPAGPPGVEHEDPPVAVTFHRHVGPEVGESVEGGFVEDPIHLIQGACSPLLV